MFEYTRRWMGAALVAGTVVGLAPDLPGAPLQQGGDRKERAQEGERARERAQGEESAKGRDQKGQRPPSDRGAGADQKRGDRPRGEGESKGQRPSDRAGEATVGSMMRFENEHRRRAARIERLMQIYREKGDQAHLEELERLRERERSLYRDGLARYERELGPERFTQVRRGMERRPTDRPAGGRNDRATDRPAKREGQETDRPRGEAGGEPRREPPRAGETDRRQGDGARRETDRQGQRGEGGAGRGDRPADRPPERPPERGQGQGKGKGQGQGDKPRDGRGGDTRKDGRGTEGAR